MEQLVINPIGIRENLALGDPQPNVPFVPHCQAAPGCCQPAAPLGFWACGGFAGPVGNPKDHPTQVKGCGLSVPFIPDNQSCLCTAPSGLIMTPVTGSAGPGGPIVPVALAENL